MATLEELRGALERAHNAGDTKAATAIARMYAQQFQTERSQSQYDTQLSPDREAAFQTWKQQNAPNDSGADYDLRGAFNAGVTPDRESGHWPDTYKKPNHPTFSDQSQYARIPLKAAAQAGHWDKVNGGEVYRSPEYMRSRANAAQRAKGATLTGYARAIARGVPVLGSVLDEANAATNATLDPLVPQSVADALGLKKIPGKTWGERYGNELENQRGMDRAFDASQGGASTIAKGIGGVATGAGAMRSLPVASNYIYGILPNSAPLWERMAAGGAAEAGLNFLHGFGSGEGDFKERLSEGKKQGALGAIVGAAAPAITDTVGKVLGAAKAARSQNWRKAGEQAYKAADAAGVVVDKNSYQGFLTNLRDKLAEEGVDEGMHPGAITALKYLEKKGNDHLTLKGMELARRNIGRVAGSPDPGTRHFGMVMKRELDDYLANITPNDVIMGDAKAGLDALKQARTAWQTSRKLGVVEGLVHKAENSASRFSQSGLENSLRDKFRTFSNNEARMRGFTPDERAAIERVSRGTLTGNALRFVGKMKPTGVVSALPTIAATSQLGPEAGLALASTGAAARSAATASTMHNIERLQKLIEQGGLAHSSRLNPGGYFVALEGAKGAAERGGASDPLAFLQAIIQSAAPESVTRPVLRALGYGNATAR